MTSSSVGFSSFGSLIVVPSHSVEDSKLGISSFGGGVEYIVQTFGISEVARLGRLFSKPLAAIRS